MSKSDKRKDAENSLCGYYDGPVVVRNIPYDQLLEEIRLEEEKCKTLTEWEAI